MAKLTTGNPTSPFDGLQQKMQDVDRLLEIHGELTGTKKYFSRPKAAVLYKSGMVLITACWEAFIEDVVTKALDFIVTNIPAQEKLPKELKMIVAQHIKDDKHELSVWTLAGEKWKVRTADILKRPVDGFHVPTSDKVDKLFKKVINLEDVSKKWSWQGMTKKKAGERLNGYIDIRHDIAHKSKTDAEVLKWNVQEYGNHVCRIAKITCNTTRNYVHKITNEYPWDETQ